jgi:hypothetical protein
MYVWMTVAGQRHAHAGNPTTNMSASICMPKIWDQWHLECLVLAALVAHGLSQQPVVPALNVVVASFRDGGQVALNKIYRPDNSSARDTLTTNSAVLSSYTSSLLCKTSKRAQRGAQGPACMGSADDNEQG